MDTDIKAFESETRNLQTSQSKLKSQIDENAENRRRFGSISSELRGAKAQLGVARAAVRKNGKEIGRLTQNVNRYRQTIGELQREVDVLSQENKGYAAEDRRLRDDLDVLQSQTPGSPRANKELRSLNKERQALLQQLEANDENLVRLTISEGSLKKDLQTQRINSNERHQRIGGLKNQLNEAQGELALASNELKTASHLLTAAQQDVDDQTTLLQISSAELATAEARLAEAQLGSDTAQVDVDTQAAMVDALRDQGVSDAASTGDAVGEAISSTGAPVFEDIPSTGDVVTDATVGPDRSVDNVPTAPQFKPRSFH